MFCGLTVPVNSLVRHLYFLPDTPTVSLVVTPLSVHILRMFQLIIATLQGLCLQHLQTLSSPHHADLPPHLLQVVHGAVVASIGILQHLQESSPGLKQLRIKWKDLVTPSLKVGFDGSKCFEIETIHNSGLL